MFKRTFPTDVYFINMAQKALNYRIIDKVMKTFFDIEVAPITISKRHGIKKLDNIYNYL